MRCSDPKHQLNLTTGKRCMRRWRIRRLDEVYPRWQVYRLTNDGYTPFLWSGSFRGALRVVDIVERGTGALAPTRQPPLPSALPLLGEGCGADGVHRTQS